MHTKLSDCLLLFYKLKELNSFSWQNFIGLLYVEIYRKMWFINPERLYKELLIMFEGWIENIKQINTIQNLLVKGLVYIYYSHPCMGVNNEDFEIIEKKACQYMNELENDNSILEELQNGTTNNKLRTRDKNEGMEWDYAFLQMGMISTKIPKKWKYVVWDDKLRDKKVDQEMAEK